MIKIPAYFNFELKGKVYEYQAESLAEIKNKADECWADKNPNLPNGYTAEGKCDILAIDENDEIIERIPYDLETTGYHGDEIEHGTWGY